MAEKVATINRVQAREGEITTFSIENNSNLYQSLPTERLDMFNGVSIDSLTPVFLATVKVAAEMATALIVSGVVFCALVCLKFIPSSSAKSFNNHCISESECHENY